MNRYPIYGGPRAGDEAEETATVYAMRPDVVPPLQSADTPGIELPRYEYDLISVGDHRAFLPRNGQDLLTAYQCTIGETSDHEADALLAEMRRRHLAI